MCKFTRNVMVSGELKIGGVAPNALHICVGGSYVLLTVVEALCELPRA